MNYRLNMYAHIDERLFLRGLVINKYFLGYKDDSHTEMRIEEKLNEVMSDLEKNDDILRIINQLTDGSSPIKYLIKSFNLDPDISGVVLVSNSVTRKQSIQFNFADETIVLLQRIPLTQARITINEYEEN